MQLENRFGCFADHVDMSRGVVVGVDHHPEAVESKDCTRSDSDIAQSANNVLRWTTYLPMDRSSVTSQTAAGVSVPG
jgi:hypothetical protein